MVKDAIVVGCGIIGATISKALAAQGRDVLVLDDRRPNSGTVPSGGHLKPSWFGGMPKNQYVPAMDLLDQLWGLHKEDFVIRPTGLTTTVYRVNTDLVVQHPCTQGRVAKVENLSTVPAVHYRDLLTGENVRAAARLLVLATGVWARELLPDAPEVKAKKGVSFRFKTVLSQPFIKPWAPYKQVVAHQQTSEEVWIGDGSALLESTWSEERTRTCRVRCKSALRLSKEDQPTRTLLGLRPYCDTRDGPCLLKQLGPRAWLATGAGKSGTISAGWVAKEILNAQSS